MEYSSNYKSFLATSSSRFLKTGFIVAISLVIMAFQIPFHKTVEKTLIFESDAAEASTEFVVANYSEKKEVPKAKEVLPPPTNPIIVTTPIDPPDLPDLDPIKEIEPEQEINPTSLAPEIAPVEKDPIVPFPEKMPEFPGGDAALINYLSTIKYCPMALDENIQGTVHVQFVVNKKGEIENVKALNSIDKCLDNAAVKAVKAMSQWTPGSIGYKKVSVRMTVPISFKIRD